VSEFADCIHTTTTHRLSFWARIKVLFGAPIVTRLEIDCQHVVGKTKTRSEGYVPSLFAPRPMTRAAA